VALERLHLFDPDSGAALDGAVADRTGAAG
jgi:hypothetical protein